jgi:hypothetical protein
MRRAPKSQCSRYSRGSEQFVGPEILIAEQVVLLHGQMKDLRRKWHCVILRNCLHVGRHARILKLILAHQGAPTLHQAGFRGPVVAVLTDPPVQADGRRVATGARARFRLPGWLFSRESGCVRSFIGNCSRPGGRRVARSRRRAEVRQRCARDRVDRHTGCLSAKVRQTRGGKILPLPWQDIAARCGRSHRSCECNGNRSCVTVAISRSDWRRCHCHRRSV